MLTLVNIIFFLIINYTFYKSGEYYFKAVAIYENREFNSYLENFLNFSIHSFLVFIPFYFMDKNRIKDLEKRRLFTEYINKRICFFFLFIGSIIFLLVLLFVFF